MLIWLNPNNSSVWLLFCLNTLKRFAQFFHSTRNNHSAAFCTSMCSFRRDLKTFLFRSACHIATEVLASAPTNGWVLAIYGELYVFCCILCFNASRQRSSLVAVESWKSFRRLWKNVSWWRQTTAAASVAPAVMWTTETARTRPMVATPGSSRRHGRHHRRQLWAAEPGIRWMPVDAEVLSPPLTVACSNIHPRLTMINSRKNRLKDHTHISVPTQRGRLRDNCSFWPSHNLSKFCINQIKSNQIKFISSKPKYKITQTKQNNWLATGKEGPKKTLIPSPQKENK